MFRKKFRKWKKEVTRITEKFKQIPSKTKKLEVIGAKGVPENKKAGKRGRI